MDDETAAMLAHWLVVERYETVTWQLRAVEGVRYYERIRLSGCHRTVRFLGSEAWVVSHGLF